MKYYSFERLMKVAQHRGYVTSEAIALALCPLFGVSKRVVHNRLVSGRLSKEECEVIGSYFEMSMKEYYDVFMNGLFVEDQEGHYVCLVEEPYLHLHPNIKAGKRKSKAEKTQEILREIEDI